MADYPFKAFGQAKIAVTNTAVKLPANSVNNIVITAKSTNTNPIEIGISSVTNTNDGTGNGYILEAGNSIIISVPNTNILFINGSSGDIISFIAS